MNENNLKIPDILKEAMEPLGIEETKELLEDALYYLDQGGSWYGYSPPTLEG